jgi:predicted acyl esterase
MSVQTDAGVASWTWGSPTSPTALLGAPVVSLSVRSTGADAELDTRLWLESGNTQTLMSTTAYRFVSTPSSTDSTVTFELPMTAWLLEPGQTLKLEVTGDDEPSYEYDAVAATTTVDKATLTLPTTDPSAYGQPLKQTATHGVAKTMRIGAFEGTSATQAGLYGATVDWGDGTTSAGAVSYYGNNVYQVLATHSWAAAGTHPIVLKVTAPHSITVTYHTTATVS